MSRLAATVVLALSLLTADCRASVPANLIVDGSFEKVKSKDRFGRVFSEWLGWIYEKHGWFEASPLAYAGKYSCLMRADQSGKIRITSPKMPLPPGRYSVSFALRGLDIAPHRYNKPIDFSMGFDDKFLPIRKTGSFDWGRLHYVFDVPSGLQRQPQLFIGLHTTGWLWVDDVQLVRVDNSVALTEEIQWQQEPGPIRSSKQGDKTRRCPECGFFNKIGNISCFGCGTPLPAASDTSVKNPAELLLADFETTKKPFQDGKLDTLFATQGTQGLRLQNGWNAIEERLDFSGYDELAFDVYNPHKQSVPVLIEIRDVESNGYWGRVNYNSIAVPGKSTIVIPTQLYVGEKARPGRMLLTDRITFFSIGIGEMGPLYIDRLRLRRVESERVLFDGLLSFDFGTLGAPVIETALPVHKGQTYLKERGYGFVDAQLWRSHNMLQPDPLVQDFVCPESGIFRVTVPNGRYRIGMKVDSPGGYWGEVQRYKERRILVNGQGLVQDRMSFPSFVEQYFADAEREDLPGEDPFERYIEGRIPWHFASVDVVDGMLDVEFFGRDWAICLSSLVIFPEQARGKGEAYVTWLDDRRRFLFRNAFVQRPDVHIRPHPARELLADLSISLPEAGRLPGPTGDTGSPFFVGEAGVHLTLAGGESHFLPLAVNGGESGKGDHLQIRLTELNSGSGLTLAADRLETGWLDFRIHRDTMDGAVWSLRPRYYHPGGVGLIPGLTRTFLLGFHIPVDQAAGVYTGKILIERAGEIVRTLPLHLEVLPFALEPIEDVAVGPWGSSIEIPWFDDDKLAQQWNRRMFSRSLKSIRAVGATSFSGRPSVRQKAQNGIITLDTELADWEMTVAAKLGFHHMISSYGLSNTTLGYKISGYGSGPDGYSAKSAGFADPASYLGKLYRQLDDHAVRRRWLPVAWNLADEPTADTIDGAVKNARLHREIAKDLQKVTFMGETSLTKDISDEKRQALVRELPLVMLNLHDEKAISLIHDNRNLFGFYNGANRWTMGRYMKMLAVKYNLAMRLVWHFNNVAGNPYFALDCREDDYCWYNSNKEGELVPSVDLLTEILPGLNDYRYLSLLQRLLRDHPDDPSHDEAQRIFDELMAIEPGNDRDEHSKRLERDQLAQYNLDRERIVKAILSLR